MTYNNLMRFASWALGGLFVVVAHPIFESEAQAAASSYETDDFLEKLLQTPFPFEPSAFLALGVSGFSQVGPDSSLNIEYRSDPVMMRDGTTAAFVAYRVGSKEERRANFVLVQMAVGSCYPLSKLQKRYGLEVFITPPNPHSASIVASVNKNLYRAAYAGGELMVKSDGTAKSCVVSLSRSRY